MDNSWSLSPWKAIDNSSSWQVVGEKNTIIATIAKSDKSEQYARLIAASPFLLKALEAFVYIVGDDDLPDNGEIDGFVLCDMAKKAIELAGGEIAHRK